MARDYERADSEGTYNRSRLVTAFPCTLAIRATPESLSFGETKTLLSIDAREDDFSAYYSVRIDFEDNLFRAYMQEGATSDDVRSASLSAGSDYNLVGVFHSATHITIYVNGTETDDTGVTSMDPWTISVPADESTNIGYQWVGFGGNHSDGVLQDAVLSTNAWGQAEADAWQSQYDPDLIDPDGLVDWWPLGGNDSPEPGIWGGNDMTLEATPDKAAQIATYSSVRTYSFPPPSAAPPAAGAKRLTLLGAG